MDRDESAREPQAPRASLSTDVYFHEHSVVDASFANLPVDAEARRVLAEVEGRKGPRAGIVAPVGKAPRLGAALRQRIDAAGASGERSMTSTPRCPSAQYAALPATSSDWQVQPGISWLSVVGAARLEVSIAVRVLSWISNAR